MRSLQVLILAMVIGAVGARSVRAELTNLYAPPPHFDTTGSQLVFQGDVRAFIDLASVQTDPVVNPFAYVNQNFFGGVGTSTVTATLDSSGNTVVTFTGSNPITTSYLFNYGPGSGGLPHFGIDASVGASVPGGGPTLKTLSLTLTDFATNTSNLPTLSVSGPTETGVTISYVTLFANVTSGTQTIGQWFEVPYDTGTSPSLTLTNYGATSESLSNVGYLLTSTMIPLDQLNWPTEPPPGSAGSHFILLPQLDGQSLGGNGGSIIASIPEPSGAISLGIGLFTLGCGFLLRPLLARILPVMKTD